jgi:hypothetical protein
MNIPRFELKNVFRTLLLSTLVLMSACNKPADKSAVKTEPANSVETKQSFNLQTPLNVIITREGIRDIKPEATMDVGGLTINGTKEQIKIVKERLPILEKIIYEKLDAARLNIELTILGPNLNDPSTESLHTEKEISDFNEKLSHIDDIHNGTEEEQKLKDLRREILISLDMLMNSNESNPEFTPRDNSYLPAFFAKDVNMNVLDLDYVANISELMTDIANLPRYLSKLNNFADRDKLIWNVAKYSKFLENLTNKQANIIYELATK